VARARGGRAPAVSRARGRSGARAVGRSVGRAVGHMYLFICIFSYVSLHMYLFICISSYVVHAFFISSYVSFPQKDNAPISTIAYNFNPVASTQFWVRNQELLRTEGIIKTYRFRRACSCSLPPTGLLIRPGATMCA